MKTQKQHKNIFKNTIQTFGKAFVGIARKTDGTKYCAGFRQANTRYILFVHSTQKQVKNISVFLNLRGEKYS